MSFALDVIVKTTMLLLFAGVLCASLRKASASARHAIWATVLLALLVFPVAAAVFPSIELAILPQRTEPAVESAPVSAIPASELETVPVETKQGWSPVQWGVAIWALGFCVIALQTGVAWRELHKVKASSRFLSGDSWPALLADAQRLLSVSKLVQVRASENPGPLTSGILTPTILLPATANEWSSTRRQLVLAHEMAHVKRNDALIQVLCQAVCALYWFNPLVWYAIRQLRLERERACDDYVLGLGGSAPDYADHLLEIARGLNSGFALAAVSMAQPSHLKSRVVAILDSRIRRSQMTKASAAILFGIAAVLTVSLATVHVTAVAAPAPVLQTPALVLPVTPPAVQERSPGYVVNRAPLSYPQAALRKGIQGTVVVELSFNADGEIVDSHVLSGPEELRQAALQTAIGGKYEINVQRSLQVVVDFKMPSQGTAVLSGAVVNASGLAVPGATITAVNTQTQVITRVITDSTGNYRLASMPAGTYRLSAELPGFRIQTFNNVPLGELMQVRMNFTLPSADSQQGGVQSPVLPFAQQPDATVTVTTSGPQRVRIGGAVMAARLIQQVKPIYPQDAKDARIQGVVVLEAEIGKDGHVTGLRVITGHPQLISAATEAVKNWVYEPVTIADKPVDVVTTVTVNFTFQQP